MSNSPTGNGRRSFLKMTALTGGGLMLGFNWSSAGNPIAPAGVGESVDVALNGYLKIAPNGVITIVSPNPEGGQNVKTAMPMIVAEELDANWQTILVEQAPLNTALYSRQTIGGSQGIRTTWNNLRKAGATARQMLIEAAASTWGVAVDEVTTDNGMLYHKKSGKSANFGEMASAAAKITVPTNVKLKSRKDYKIVGTQRRNVDGLKIVTGKPLYGIDVTRKGMLIAMITHPPAFGLKMKSLDDSEARKMPGIKDIFTIKTYKDDFAITQFDTNSFPDLIVVVGTNTWEVMNAKKALKVEWEPLTSATNLESTERHRSTMQERSRATANVLRKNGDPDAAFANAAKVIERTYTAPFLAHNCMEPMNFFAHVTAEKAELEGPLQKPENTEKTLSARLGLPLDKIDIKMTRLGGGFGRRSYAHWLIEAALISQKMNAPVKLIYTREDDMTSGIYRPAYHVTYRAALDQNNNLTAFHVRGGGIPQSSVSANRFPAGAVDNYLAESWSIPSNISVGSFRAPGSNFIAGAEQSFLDEVAEAAGKDPIEFRLELLARAAKSPVGQGNDYDPARYAGVLELVREKSDWNKKSTGLKRGVSAYFCHNTYAAQVVDVSIRDHELVVEKVCCAVDCGIVINPLGAVNLAEGSCVDGIGNALFGEITFENGIPQQNNFNTYRLIRHHEAPKAIDVHFVDSDKDPTGMGEPLFPPVFAALANALYRATGKRFYNQPFIRDLEKIVAT